MLEMDKCLSQADLANGNVLPKSETAMHADKLNDRNARNPCYGITLDGLHLSQPEIASRLPTTDNGHFMYGPKGGIFHSWNNLEKTPTEKMPRDGCDISLAKSAKGRVARSLLQDWTPPRRLGLSPLCQWPRQTAESRWTPRKDFPSSLTSHSRSVGLSHSLSTPSINERYELGDSLANSERYRDKWRKKTSLMGSTRDLDLVLIQGTSPFLATSTPLCMRSHAEANSSPCLTTPTSKDGLARRHIPVRESESSPDPNTDFFSFDFGDNDESSSERKVDIDVDRGRPTRKLLTSKSKRSEVKLPNEIGDDSDEVFDLTPMYSTPCLTSCGSVDSCCTKGQVRCDAAVGFLDVPMSSLNDHDESVSHSECTRTIKIESSSSGKASLQKCQDEEEGEASSLASLFRRNQIERDSGSVKSFKVSEIPAEALSMLSLRTGQLLCSERVSQMTKTYNDIEAVTRLLEEKERDLELAARIGQTLLSKNKELATRAEALEEQLTHTNDKVFQLRHELNTKEELLRFFSEDLENESTEDATPSEEDEKGKSVINLDSLQKKVQALEDENVQLRVECTELKTATDNYEDKEKKLVDDCVKQLAEVNNQVETFSQELQHKAEENSHQKEEINLLLAQVTERQKKINQLTIDNLDLHEKLTVSTESQKKLTKELGGMQDRYDEMFEKLEEMQDELCILRGKHKIRAIGRHHHHTAYTYPTDSLASELETSLQQELSQSNRRLQSWKVFETAKAAKRAIAKASSRHSASSSAQAVGSVSSQWDSDTASNISAYASDVESMNSDGYSADMDSLYESNPELGRPGIPGSSDLESALRSLDLNRCGEKGNRTDKSLEHGDENLIRKLSKVEHQSPRSGQASPGGSSLSSSLPGCGNSSIAGSSGGFMRSDKLQIVKPLEGSMTLRHWQQLATPHLGGIFEQREGVQMKGERKLELKEERYSLSDFEEDEDVSEAATWPDRASPYLAFTEGPEKYAGTYNGLGALLDPRTPSPSLFSLKSSHSSSNSSKSLPTSSTKLAAPAVTTEPIQNTQPKSLGLAELLSNRENSALGRALTRASSLSARKGISASPTAVSSQPAELLNDTTVLSRSTNCLPQASSVLGGSPVHFSSKYRNLPGSRSLEEVSVTKPGEAEATFTFSTTPVQNSKHFTPGMTGQSFLQQLKNRGYSLYGLWSGAASLPSSSSANKTTKSNFGMAHASKATGLELDSSVHDEEDDTVSASNILPPGTGVLGALTNFRRGGIL